MEKFSKDNRGKELTVNDLKKHLFKMLCALADFCEKNGIRYYLSGGTLLGAVRNNGFIPWDDDIDINIPRPDCIKLQNLSKGIIENYVLIPPSGDSLYPNIRWRLYDETIIIENSIAGTSKKPEYLPAYIDIYPIEGLPHNDIKSKIHYLKQYFSKKMIGCLDGSAFRGKTLKAKIFHLLGRPFAKLFGRSFWIKKIEKISCKISYDSSDYIGVMTSANHTFVERVKKNEYEPQIEVIFEGKYFKAPKGYNSYLSQLYGKDYLLLPPIEKRKSHHGYKIYKTKNIIS